MRTQSEQGYILASTLSALFAMSLVLAAMVSLSVDGLRREKVAERRSADTQAMDAAVLLAAVQLTQDPRRRSMTFGEQGEASVAIGDRSVRIEASWEGVLLDVNRADISDVERTLEDGGASAEFRGRISARLATIRAASEEVKLLDDLTRRPGELACLEARLTVFGGQPELREDAGPLPIGQPVPGSVIKIATSVGSGPGSQRLTKIVMLTGDPQAPYRTLDVRPVRPTQAEACHGV